MPLDPTMLEFCQPLHCRGAIFRTGPTRHVIDIMGMSTALAMASNALICILVGCLIWREDSTAFTRGPWLPFVRWIASCVALLLHLPIDPRPFHLVDHDLDDLDMLPCASAWPILRSCPGNDRIDSPFFLQSHQFAQAFLVDLTSIFGMA